MNNSKLLINKVPSEHTELSLSVSDFSKIFHKGFKSWKVIVEWLEVFAKLRNITNIKHLNSPLLMVLAWQLLNKGEA